MDEVLLYLVGFWRFVFSSSFRARWITEFRSKEIAAKLFSLLEGAISIAIGVGVPVIVAFAILSRLNSANAVDSCLDSGGSYNYESCSCGHKENHPYIENNKCK